ncbi:MAG: hypothetical protein OXJ52_01475 [Oligoflexia bacterium]|nr:hypothetical protein [Oligoflexia bacterium]
MLGYYFNCHSLESGNLCQKKSKLKPAHKKRFYDVRLLFQLSFPRKRESLERNQDSTQLSIKEVL